MSEFGKMILNILEARLPQFNYEIIFEVCLVILITFLINIFLRRILKKLHDKAKKSKSDWDDTFIASILSPAKLFVLGQGLILAFEIAYISKEANFLTSLIIKTRILILIIVFAWFALRFIREFELIKIKKMTNSGRYTDRTTVRAVAKLLRVIVCVSSFIICFESLGINVSGLLAIAGIGTAAMGFASKDLVANFFGTLVIHLDKPFAEGDWISSPDKNIEGVVEEIGWRITKLRTFERRPIYVPNSVFSSAVIQNNTRMYHRRFKKILTVRFKDINLVQKITEEIKTMLDQHQDIAQDQIKYVKLSNFSSYSVDIDTYCFTKTIDWIEFQNIQQELLLKIAKIITDNKADFAFPTTTLDIDSGSTLQTKLK